MSGKAHRHERLEAKMNRVIDFLCWAGIYSCFFGFFYFWYSLFLFMVRERDDVYQRAKLEIRELRGTGGFLLAEELTKRLAIVWNRSLDSLFLVASFYLGLILCVIGLVIKSESHSVIGKWCLGIGGSLVFPMAALNAPFLVVAFTDGVQDWVRNEYAIAKRVEQISRGRRGMSLRAMAVIWVALHRLVVPTIPALIMTALGFWFKDSWEE